MTNITRQAYEEVKPHIGSRPVWAKCTLGDWLLIDAAEIRNNGSLVITSDNQAGDVMWARCSGRAITSADDDTLPAIGEWFVAIDADLWLVDYVTVI
jgi:hypothetical protein